MRTLDDLARLSIKLTARTEREMARKYRWKAQNIVRFFDGLGMTTEEKVEFLSREFARVILYTEPLRQRESKKKAPSFAGYERDNRATPVESTGKQN